MAGRPRTFDRQQALDTAMEQFWSCGYDQTTVAGLTDAMGITAPSLYAAFGDKDQLFEEAAVCYSTRVEAALEQALDQPTTAAGLAELMRITAQAHTDPMTPAGCFVISEPRLGDYRSRLRDLVARRVARGAQDGDVPADTDPGTIADYVIAVLAGMSARARDGATADEVRAIAQMALKALPDGPGATAG
jgi:AcrR family transcriptional regulator